MVISCSSIKLLLIDWNILSCFSLEVSSVLLTTQVFISLLSSFCLLLSGMLSWFRVLIMTLLCPRCVHGCVSILIYIFKHALWMCYSVFLLVIYLLSTKLNTFLEECIFPHSLSLLFADLYYYNSVRFIFSMLPSLIICVFFTFLIPTW
jgi:hypothetical protein